MKNLKVRIIALVCMLSVILLAVTISVGYFNSYKIVLKESKQKTINSVEKYSEEINGWLLSQGKMVDEMANDIQFYNNYDSKVLFNYFKNKMASNPNIISFYMGFPDKKFISGDGWVPDASYDCTTREWYTMAEKSDAIVYTAPYLDATTGKMVITIGKKIMKDGTLLGVAAADIYVDYLTKIVETASVEAGSYAFLLDERDNFIVHPNKEYKPTADKAFNMAEVADKKLKPLVDILSQGKSGIETSTDYDGVSKYFAFAPIQTTKWTVGFAIPVQEFKKPLNSLVLGFALAFGVGLLLAAAAIFLIVRSIIKPISRLKQHTQQIADGDLTHMLEIESNDELGKLSESFNTMVENLKTIVADISATSQVVRQSSENLKDKSLQFGDMLHEISGATEEVSAESNDLLKNVASASDFLEGVSGKIAEASKETVNITKGSDKIKDIVNVGYENLNKLKDIQQEEESQSAQMYRIIDGFTQSAQGISDITSVIHGLSGQTNMLALNAAIEAARAGEAGKGFAIVAQEVRKLAEESANAAVRIEELVQSVKDEAERFESIKSQSRERNEFRNSINEKIINEYNSIADSVKESITSVNDINSKMQTIDSDREEIGKLMKNLSKITDGTSAAIYEVAESVSNQVQVLSYMLNDINALNERIAGLGSSVNKFKV